MAFFVYLSGIAIKWTVLGLNIMGTIFSNENKTTCICKENGSIFLLSLMKFWYQNRPCISHFPGAVYNLFLALWGLILHEGHYF